MRLSHASEADAMMLRLGTGDCYIESEEVTPGNIFDYDKKGNVIGIEVLYVSERERSAAILPVGNILTARAARDI